MSWVIAFELMMLVTSGCALVVSGWLLLRARKRRSLQALAGFGLMMALWCSGHVAIQQGWHDLGILLILSNPLMPTFFLHFATRFVRPRGPGVPRLLHWFSLHIGAIYAASFGVILLSWNGPGGTVVPLGPFTDFFVFQGLGWFNIAYTVIVGILAHLVLVWGLSVHHGNLRRSIVAMFAASAWGLLLATSFIFPSLGFDWYPYPMLLLPSYVVLLVYGVVRYQILESNDFARRMLPWLVLMAVMLGVMALLSALAGHFGLVELAAVPLWQLWLCALMAVAVALLLRGPLKTLSGLLIYPGVRLDESLLDRWQSRLKSEGSWQGLQARATELISAQMRQSVHIQLQQEGAMVPPPSEGGLSILCQHQARGWRFRLQGWEDLKPGLRLTGEVFGSLLSTSCGLLERSLQLAEAERSRLASEHLVELGSLSAIMAHELRNPLNVISMATADLPGERRSLIQTQLQRADRQISDLLLYAGRLELRLQPVLLPSMVDSLVPLFDWQQTRFESDIPAGLTLLADQHRLQQVFTNLVENALSFVRNQPGSLIRIDSDADGRCIRIHNNGPAIDASLHATLFHPFVSRRAGGSGLGLAIVRRIMDAHGGAVRLREDLGWPVTFELSFPRASEA
ncbi:sensor histidine kinase [Marinobacterium rhizophilum]|uniref:sensor histidine kinase n=1 Tax=Marinobacterium rhizophilum TaxID=420402 RepID=UPI00036DD3F1|nr:sensor histidine kinase [Marinobacterium rhizophilum]